MKRLRRLLAVLIAMVMVAATMNVAVFADDTPDTTIEISGLAAGDVVHFYKVVEWASDTQVAAHEDVAGWVATSDFSSILTSEELAKAIDSKNAAYTGVTSQLAGELARVSGKTEVASVIVTSDTATLNIENLGLGMYMALITPADVDTVYNPVFVSADYKAGDNTHAVTSESSYYNQSAAKKTTSEVEKTFENKNDYNGDDGATTKPGDTVSFTVDKISIPGFGQVFVSPEFEIKDELTALKLKADTIKISLNGTEVADNSNNEYYDLSATTSGYTVTFKTGYLTTVATPVPVIITYDAEVLESATVANLNQEKNTVTVKYSNDPENASSRKYQKDTTNHYTFSLDADNLFKTTGIVGESGSEFIKISVDSNGDPINSTVKVWSNVTPTAGQTSPLAGAKFELKDKNGNSFDPKKEAESDANGRIKFENLDAGTYILEEISAPAGFVRDTQTHTIVIDADITVQKITEYYDQSGNWYKEAGTGRTAFTYDTDILNSYTVTVDGEDVATHTFMHTSNDEEIKWSSSESKELPSSIRNTKGVELPSTGGMGTTLFYAIGTILVLGAGILLVTRRRMEAN